MSSREQAKIQPGNDVGQCAVRRPGKTTGFGSGRLPCTREAGHEGDHRDAFGREFTNEDHGQSPVYRVMLDVAEDTPDPAEVPATADSVVRYLDWHGALARPGEDVLDALFDMHAEVVWDAYQGGALTLEGAHERLADALALVTAASGLAA